MHTSPATIRWFNESSVWYGTFGLDIRNSIGAQAHVGGFDLHAAVALDVNFQTESTYGLELGADKDLGPNVALGVIVEPAESPEGPRAVAGLRLGLAHLLYFGADAQLESTRFGARAGVGVRGSFGAAVSLAEVGVAVVLLGFVLASNPLI
jgi:hypothetical protein